MNLVTGATGLLGSHIVEQLCRRNKPVKALVRRSSDVAWLKTMPVELVYGDVNDVASLDAALEGVQTVYHAAARVGDWGPWKDFQKVSIEGTDNLIQASERAGVKRFLHISSISVYGYVDGEGKLYDESAALGHNLYRWAYYTRAKIAAEELVWAAHKRGTVEFTVIRPSWLYGERDRATIGRLVANLRAARARLLGDGENRLNVVHAGNVAEASILAAELPKASGEAYNCSNDGVLTQKAYFNGVAEAAGAPAVTRQVPYKVAYFVAFMLECIYRLIGSKNPPMITRYSVWLIGRRCFFDTSKARRDLGWESTINYEEGIRNAVNDYLVRIGERPPQTPDAPTKESVAVAGG